MSSIIGASLINERYAVFSNKIVAGGGLEINGKDLLGIISDLQRRINKLEMFNMKKDLCDFLTTDTIKIVSLYLEE